MKIKTFVNENKEELDKEVNAFEETNDVKAGHTDMILLANGSVLHKFVSFIKVPKEDK